MMLLLLLASQSTSDTSLAEFLLALALPLLLLLPLFFVIRWQIPSAGPRILPSIAAGIVSVPTSACSSSRPASPESASRASSRVRCGRFLAAISFTRQEG